MKNPPRAPVAESWYRSKLAGVRPLHALDRLEPEGAVETGPLLEASEPVLEELAHSLAYTAYATLLVDRECRIVHRTFGAESLARAFAGVGVDLGASLLEAHIGTNGPGTALETGAAVAIHGEEHFAEGLKDFSCLGYPIRHPLTKRVEGVLDISSFATDANPLLHPVLAHAVNDIERRLRERSQATDSRLMFAFQEAALRTRSALVAIGDDLTVSNRLAQDLLTSTDLAHLRMLIDELSITTRSAADLQLSSGQLVRVYADLISTRRTAALLRIEPQAKKRSAAKTSVSTEPRRGPVLVSGPAGSGRTTLARNLAGTTPVTLLSAAEALLDGDQEWARRFRQVMNASRGTLIIDGIELLSDSLLDLLTDHIGTRVGPEIVLVSGPLDGLQDRPAAVGALATHHEKTLPLAAQRDQILVFAREILGEIGTNLFLTPAAEAALAAHSWPGNLRELRAALVHAARGRTVASIAAADFPSSLSAGGSVVGSSGPLGQAERDVILHALRTVDGNKARAAKKLGISRTTLYAKMRAHRITEY
ncbi:transcriptional regulator [Epidermidibacterium keratini]|uniref:Transcriptional regulator n=1 Tax=Epidermidibacterium keratini TaxID=1891644 RepID=A0A7L4YJ87_9ACTN|nr:helix-turn-helix domain-containing protein [Epidermidibacterium keratini]QHB99171.1 transcriptional regulator [Epidermidibacterium keratini]